MRFGVIAVVCLSYVLTVVANTEKTIFIAPPVSRLPDTKPGIDFLNVQIIDNTFSTALRANFTSQEQPRGVDHWYLLRNLHEGRRYEVRLCWAATQPTRFSLSTYTISSVFDEPALVRNLDRVIRRPEPKAPHSSKNYNNNASPGSYDSVLFLHIEAAADYFSSNKTLMSHPPDVDVDIILDPYFIGILPESLIPTAGYIVVLAIVSWFISKLVWFYIRPESTEKAHKD